MKLPPQTKLVEIAKEFNLKLILLFGSRVLGQTHKESDVDLAFLPEKDLSFEDEISLNTKFCDLFKTDRVDTVNLRKANPLLRHEVSKNCQLLYGKKEILFEFKAFAFSDYIFHQPLFELEDFLIKKRQKLLAKSIHG